MPIQPAKGTIPDSRAGLGADLYTEPAYRPDPWQKGCGYHHQIDPLCSRGEYKPAYLCDHQIKGSIALLNAELLQLKYELCKEVWRLHAKRYGQRTDEARDEEEL